MDKGIHYVALGIYRGPRPTWEDLRCVAPRSILNLENNTLAVTNEKIYCVQNNITQSAKQHNTKCKTT